MNEKRSIPRIESSHNRRIVSAAQLRKRRERERTGLILIEGARELSRALEGGITISEVFVCPNPAMGAEERGLLAELEARNTRLAEVGPRAFEKISYRDSTSCFVAVAERKEKKLDALSPGDAPLFLVADAVEKPGNLGAMFRTADAAGATGLIISEPRTDVFNPNVIRSSLGTVFTVQLAVAGAEETIAWLEGRGIGIITSTPHGAIPYTEADLRSPCAIVVGSEEQGAGEIWIAASECKVRIPMKGAADSLNVSAAAAVLLYEAQRQRSSRS